MRPFQLKQRSYLPLDTTQSDSEVALIHFKSTGNGQKYWCEWQTCSSQSFLSQTLGRCRQRKILMKLFPSYQMNKTSQLMQSIIFGCNEIFKLTLRQEKKTVSLLMNSSLQIFFENQVGPDFVTEKNRSIFFCLRFKSDFLLDFWKASTVLLSTAAAAAAVATDASDVIVFSHTPIFFV